jgi:predicted RNA binding protein YcfA (HicA-like mRNA interferase family)
LNKLPDISGLDLLKILEKEGFRRVKTKGSHQTIEKITPEKHIKTSVPLHPSLAKGTLSAILRYCGISRERFLQLYQDL